MKKTTEIKARRGRPPVRGPRQRAALLSAVAQKINTDGAGAVSLTDLCSRLGLSRSSLYYYCRDANDLVFQTYQDTCRRIAGHIDWAKGLKAPADEQLSQLIRRVLLDDRTSVAALNDIDVLPVPHKQQIIAEADKNATSLADLLKSGQDKGIFRPFDAHLVARLVLNVLSWALVSLRWLNRRVDEPSQTRYVEAMTDMLLNGIVKADDKPQPCKLEYDHLTSQPFNAFDKTQTAELKATQIIAAASRLFNLRGLGGVRLEDVSADIGTSKGAIYHHFRDKTDLIERCYDRAFDIYDLIMQTGNREGRTPLDRAFLVIHLNAQAQLSTLPPLALQPGLGKLNGKKRIEYNCRAEQLDDTSQRNIEEGIANGIFRASLAEYAPSIAAGYFLGLPRIAPDTLSARQMADFIADIALYGLR
ncbi:TetR/AcrR family transcriptional regulator [Kordiimonas sp.]|uniref:TetR/AcrR family transcriptional regulator n=1 Tax=Kordiimonas sp. TaxID=1970157 RepID=UPI003A90EA57